MPPYQDFRGETSSSHREWFIMDYNTDAGQYNIEVNFRVAYSHLHYWDKGLP